MKISIVQMDVIFEQVEQNYQKLERLLQRGLEKETDIIVLPETWTTGFFPRQNLEKFVDKDGEKVVKVISNIAKKNYINIIAGSVITKRKDQIYNTSYIFNREGNVVNYYDKVHLFSPMDEHKYFDSGERLVTFQLDDVLCGVIICYDIRFLEIVRSLSLKNIDILFVVAQWPKSRIEHWRLLNRVRAIENQIYVVAVNSCGQIEDLKFGGNSMVIDPWGNIQLELGDEEEIITIDIDLNKIREVRNQMSIYNDRKPKVYEIK